MARSLSSMLLKGIAGLPATRPSRVVFGSFSHNGMRFSTTVPNDPDTHEDFKPTNKLESSDLSLNDVVEQDVKENPVMIYMKGVPEFPQCGFSSLAVKSVKTIYYVQRDGVKRVGCTHCLLLMGQNVPLASRNILEDPELKSAIKTFSHWPTFPQIFIKGEFIGGSDIILNLHQSGELKEKLKDVIASQEKSQ